MRQWPYPHNWVAPYRETLSFRTTVLVSDAGYEQRIAEREIPRQAVETTVLATSSVSRFLWSVGPELFSYPSPIGADSLTVRVAEQQAFDHPAAHVSVAALPFAVEPGSQGVQEAGGDALESFGNRYVLPFPVNWREGLPETFSFPRRTTDFDRGVIAVTRPIGFATQSGTLLLLRVGRAETDDLSAFFRETRGRQGDFWASSLLPDLAVAEIVSGALVVQGEDVVELIDEVNVAVEIRLFSGSVYRRRVTSAYAVAGRTVLALSAGFPETIIAANVERCSWLRLSRFASDDLLIEWTTSTVAQSQVQVQSLPFAAPDAPLFGDPGVADLIDYFGKRLFEWFSDPLDFIVNIQVPRLSGAIYLEEWWWTGLEQTMNGRS